MAENERTGSSEVEVLPEQARPFAAWYDKYAESVKMYLPVASSVWADGASVKMIPDGVILLAEGVWWCHVCRSAENEVYATVRLEGASISDEVLYSFKVIEVMEDNSFKQFAYGEVILNGVVPETDRRVPFSLGIVDYENEGKTERHYRLYLPEKSIQYQGRYRIIRGRSGDYYDIDLPEDSGTVYCVVEYEGESGTESEYSVRIQKTDPGVKDDVVAVFPICNISTEDAPIHHHDSPPDPGDSDSDSGSEEPAADESSQFVGGLTSAAGERGIGEEQGARYVAPLRPFGIYADAGGMLYMHVPYGALVVNSKIVNIDVSGMYGDRVLLSEGTYWCVVEWNDEDSADGDSDASEDEEVFKASIVKASERPTPDEAAYVFKIADVGSNIMADGDFKEYTYGAVTLSGLREKENLKAWELVEITQKNINANAREYYIFTPRSGCIQYNGSFIGLKDSQGSWTQIDVPEDVFENPVTYYACKKKDDDGVTLTTDSFSNGNPAFDFVFPVVGLGVDADDNVALGEARAVLACVEKSTIMRDLPGANISLDKFAYMLKDYTTDVTMLRDEDATKLAVRNAFRRAVSDEKGIAILYVSAHGDWTGASNIVYMYDETLSDSEIWTILMAAKCPVWMIFDCCHSATMYGPPSAESRAHTWGESFKMMASRSSGVSELRMLCWSGATDDTVGWVSSSSGAFFTQAIVNNVAKGLTYREIWKGVVASPEMNNPQFPQHPVASEIGLFWSDQKFLFHNA